MSAGLIPNFSLQPGALPDLDSVTQLLESAVTLDVRGRVAAVAGESIELKGMTAPLGAVCELNASDGATTLGRVIGFRGVNPIIAPLQRLSAVSAGDPVRLLDASMKLRVGMSLRGRVIDAMGRPLDGKPLPQDLRVVDADREPPQSLSRPPIDVALQTGVRAIDSMLTCGQGQRLGIFAGSGVGKSTLLGMLARGSNADCIVIGMVGERGREVREFLSRGLGEEGFRKSVVVVATSDCPAAQRVSAAWTATSIAEAFRDEGKNVLLLLDSVTRFAMAQRELGLAAGEPPTTRGYPPSVFNLLPRLVERSGRTEKGSITAFYTVLVEGDDPNEPIADTLRGLLDGHIMLSRTLAGQAHWPPIDVLESLSRLQPHLIRPEIMKSVNVARRFMGEYRRHEDLISIGAYRPGTDPNVDTAIAMHEPLRRFLAQDASEIASVQDSQAALVSLIRTVTAARAAANVAANNGANPATAQNVPNQTTNQPQTA
ncbi:MAG: FliI/YscN family ATPase [Planctomycetota bacterium]